MLNYPFNGFHFECSGFFSLCVVCFPGSKDKVTIPTSSFPRLSASDGPSSPASPSSVSLSTSELSPSSPKVSVPDELSSDPRASGSPGSGQEHGRPAGRSRGQQLSHHHNHKRTTSPSSRKPSRSDSKSASPKRAAADAERSHSPRKAERGHGGSLEDMSRERKPPGQRKGSKREQDPEGPQSPRRPAGQQPGAPSADGKDWRYREEDAGWGDGGDKGWGTSERHKKGKRAEQEAQKPPSSSSQAHRERAGSDASGGGTLGRKKPDREYWEDGSRKDPRGSSSSIQDPSCNGTSSKKTPITPGPWKVPSTAKIQSQVDTAYADV